MKKPNSVRAARYLPLPTPLAGFGALFALALSLRCAGKSNEDGAAGGHAGTGSASAGAGAGGMGGVHTAGAGATSVSGSGGVSGSGAQGGTAGGSGSCTTSTVANDCPLQASTCAADERTLMYSTASCEGGQCVYSTQTYACMGLCAGGACLASTTTTSGSPPPSTCTPSNEGTAGQAGDTAYTPGDCPIPASTCADASTLDYYVVQCVNGQCVTSLQAMRCAVYCVNGACQGNFTAR